MQSTAPSEGSNVVPPLVEIVAGKQVQMWLFGGGTLFKNPTLYGDVVVIRRAPRAYSRRRELNPRPTLASAPVDSNAVNPD